MLQSMHLFLPSVCKFSRWAFSERRIGEHSFPLHLEYATQLRVTTPPWDSQGETFGFRGGYREASRKEARFEMRRGSRNKVVATK